jgi:hypothetical protein
MPMMAGRFPCVKGSHPEQVALGDRWHLLARQFYREALDSMKDVGLPIAMTSRSRLDAVVDCPAPRVKRAVRA